jgi:hypothetical protein
LFVSVFIFLEFSYLVATKLASAALGNAHVRQELPTNHHVAENRTKERKNWLKKKETCFPKISCFG